MEAKLSTCTEDEEEGEQSVKVDDHGMDCVRYMVAHRDLVMGRRAKGRSRTVEIDL